MKKMKQRTGKVYNVQYLVETPEIYILDNANDSLAEKLSYTETCLEDIKQMEIPMIINVEILDTMRIFLGKLKFAVHVDMFINMRHPIGH